VAGNVSCAAPSPTPNPNPFACNGTAIEDDDPHISYSNGWHAINNSGAYGGHYRFNEGGSNQHNVVLTFDTPDSQAGSITYFFATSQKGGSAQVLVDGSSQGTVNYNSASGSNRSPNFGASKSFPYGATPGGHHTLEIRPIRDAIFIDGFCIGNATVTGSPASHPGTTSESLATQSAGQALLKSITLPAGTQAISIAAESSVAVPIQLVLINPSGTVVQTVQSSSGVAILEADSAKRCLHHQDSQSQRWASANLVSVDSASVNSTSSADVERVADRVAGRNIASEAALAAIVEHPARSLRASAGVVRIRRHFSSSVQ